MMEGKSDQRVRLDTLDAREAGRLLTGMMATLSPEREYELRHEDYVMEMPQSGERFRGRDNVRAFQEAFTDHSAPPTIRLRRLIVKENLWIVESVINYGGPVLHGAAILEIRDGKWWRDTRYFAEPFEPPAWRAQWIERMGPEETAPAGSQRTTDADEIRESVDRQFAMMQAGDFAGAHAWYDESVVVEWPQSGERIRGKKNLLALREAYPSGVEFEVRRLITRPDLGVCEYVIRYDGRPVHALGIVEFGDGRVVRETHYFADPFEPPEWRARWVERMEGSDNGSG